VVGEAEAALAVAHERGAIERAQLERVEPHQVPVMVRRGVRVAEPRDVAVDADVAVREQDMLRARHPRRARRPDADELGASEADVVDE